MKPFAACQGKVFYYNEKENLRVILEWCNSGWTSREAATADSNISGARLRSLSSDTPWADILEVYFQMLHRIMDLMADL